MDELKLDNVNYHLIDEQMDDHEKIDLNISLFDYGYRLADQRMKQKGSYESCNPLSNNYEFVGILGELIYSYIMGEEMDTRLRINGDNGLDFSKLNVQVKTSEEHKARHLIEYLDKKIKFDYYVFVVVNLEEKTGYIRGWISVKDFMEKRFLMDFGYGQRWAMELDELNPWKKKVNVIL